jgi:hypothetical protein
MHRVIFLILACAAWQPAGAQDVTKYSPETILQLINILVRDPISERGVAARAVILEFAEKSDAVLIEVSERAMPWAVDERVPEQARLVLTGAYVAGNVKSQLERHVNANDSMAGWKEVFRAYDVLRKHAAGLRVPGVEELLEEDKSGRLQERAVELEGQGSERV